MKDFLRTNKKTLLVIVIVVIGFVIYSLFFAGGTEEELLVAESGANDLIGAELLTILLDLKTITLDDSLFKRDAFLSLVDFSRPITPEPIGRPNPFVPIGTEGDTPFREDDLGGLDFAPPETVSDDTDLTDKERKAILDALGI